MEIEIQEVPREDKSVLRALMELYLYDYSEFSGADVTEHGTYPGYPYLDHYWTEERRHPFFVRVDAKLAGFVLVRSELTGTGEPSSALAEFFIMRKYRRQSVGQQVATLIFDRFPGEWSVSHEDINPAAGQFWRHVIGDYTGGQFTEHRPHGKARTVKRFSTPRR